MKTNKEAIRKPLLLSALVVIALLFAVSITLTTTYHYYGEYLSHQALQDRYENNNALHCVQASSVLGIAHSFECFDTIAEADAFAMSIR